MNGPDFNTESNLHPDTVAERWDSEQEDEQECQSCGGSGCDPFESFMPCEECDGTGYMWW